MFRKILTIAALFFVLALAATESGASPFFFVSNEIGYTGTVTYIPYGGGSPTIYNTATPRDALVYFDAYMGTSYNVFGTNWSQHPASNTSDSFFQLYGINGASITNMTGSWNSNFTSFTMTVTGANATYANATSRAWMPDQNVAAGGTWTNYTLTLTASGVTSGIQNGYRVNLTNPVLVTGSFTGTFVSDAVMHNGTQIYGNTYFVTLNLSNLLFDPTNFDNSSGAPSTLFGSPIPVPGAVWLLGFGLVGLGIVRRRKGKLE